MASEPGAPRIWRYQSAGATPLAGVARSAAGVGQIQARAASVSINTAEPARAVRIRVAVSGNNLAK